jgi:hypothetical protein
MVCVFGCEVQQSSQKRALSILLDSGALVIDSLEAEWAFAAVDEKSTGNRVGLSKPWHPTRYVLSVWLY